MKLTLMTDEVARALINDKNAAWTRAGAYALAEYLEEIERESATEMELDVVSIRCDFSEFSNATLAALACDWQKDEEKSDEENEADALEYLKENTSVISFDGGLIIQDF